VPTDPENVRLWGKTGSGLCTVKTARLTLSGPTVERLSPGCGLKYQSYALIGPSLQLDLALIIPRPGRPVVTQSCKAAEGTSREALLDMLTERDRELAQAHEQQAASLTPKADIPLVES
jgi:hypothetical protein